jgi:putative ABC transport system permease protein
MIRNYLAIARRNIAQNPLYTFINLFSLAIGLAASVAIYLFVTDEQSFDAFNKQKDSVYRLDEVQNFTGTTIQKVALSMSGMGPAMQTDFPEVSDFTRYWSRGGTVVKKEEEQLLVDNIAAVDSTFLKIFDYELLTGNRATALNEPNSILLTEKTARKIFKDPAKAMNNTLTLRDAEYKVTGLLKNIPENSHLQFDGLISMSTYTRKDSTFNNRWGGNFLNTYFVLHPGTDINRLETKFPDFMVRHTGEKDINQYYTLFLQPLADVHLGSTDIEHDYNNYRKFNGAYLDVFTIIGIFILLIASVNFMNLTTARASHRWKEIGVRKTVGALKRQLFGQFIFESTLLSLLALVLAGLFDLIFIPLLNQAIGRQLTMASFLVHPWHLLAAFGTTLLLGVLTGIYPSFYMTSFNLSRVLKGGSKSEGRSVFRSSLVVLQFGLAMAMIVSTFIVVQQLDFMKNGDLGFDKDQIMLIGMNKEVNEKFEGLKTEWLRSSYIQGVTASGQRIGNNFHQWGFKIKGDTGIVQFTPSNVNVEYDYFNVYGIKILEGRGFSKSVKTDNGMAFVINESMAKSLRLKEPVGTRAGHNWYKDDSLGTIIGVAKDFNFNSMHHKINTLSLVCHPDWGYDEISIKVDAAHMKEAIAAVKEEWDKNITTYPFNYSFLDEHFDTLYRSDQQLSSVVTIMAGLAILISCMGLFGLAAITTERKTKEIGIRKALGATASQITLMLSGNFARLIFVAFLVSSPATYFLLSGWLQHFAYRIGINPLLFLAGGLVALVVALTTISYHALKSARSNPVVALRYE